MRHGNYIYNELVPETINIFAFYNELHKIVAMNRNAEPKQPEKIITTTCSYDCGGRCILKIHVSDGKIVKIGTDNTRGTGHMELGSLAEPFEVPCQSNPKSHMTKIYDALLEGKAGGFQADIKLVYIV